MDSYSNKIVIIDNEVTKDKYEIGSYLGKTVLIKKLKNTKLLIKKNLAKIFYELLLLEQSSNRKT